MKKNYFLYAAIVTAAITLTACSKTEYKGPSQAKSSALLKQDKILKTGKTIYSISFIPHSDEMTIAAALGEDGVLILDTEGNTVWRDTQPAKLVAYYQDNLVVYRDHGDQSVLDRYKIDDTRAPTKVSSDSPSPIAATTLQRTAFSPLGPLRISEDKIRINETDVQLNSPAAAVAATKAAAANYPDGIAAIAMTNGDIQLFPLHVFKNAN